MIRLLPQLKLGV